MYFEVFHIWRENDTELLPLLRTLYSYSEREPDRATGWLWSDGQHGQLPPRDWPEALKDAGPELAEAIRRKSWRSPNRDAYTAAAYQAYLNGSGTGWHYDREWDCQAILSLGVTRTFGVRSRENGKTAMVPVRHGSLLLMYPGFQDRFEHCVLPEPDVRGERVSVVFRGCYRPLAALLS